MSVYAQDANYASQLDFQKVFAEIAQGCGGSDSCQFQISAYGVLTEMEVSSAVVHMSKESLTSVYLKRMPGFSKERSPRIRLLIRQRVFDFYVSAYGKEMVKILTKLNPDFFRTQTTRESGGGAGLWKGTLQFLAWTSVGRDKHSNCYGSAPYSQFTKVCSHTGFCARSPGFMDQ